MKEKLFMGQIYQIGVTKIRATNLSTGYKSVNLAPYLRVWPGRPDPIREEIIERASQFNFLDRQGHISDKVNKNKNYMARLTAFWGIEHLKLDLQIDLWSSKRSGEFFAPEWNLNAITISCADITMPFRNGDVIWEGYQEINNFRNIFFPNIINDSQEKIKGLFISSFGDFDLLFESSNRLNENIIINAAVCFAIMRNIKYLEYK